MNSFIEVTTTLLGVPGVTYALSERFCQDPFCQDYRGGFGDNPSVKEFLDNTVSLRVQGSAALEPLRGNCTRKRNSTRIADDTPLPKRKRTSQSKK